MITYTELHNDVQGVLGQHQLQTTVVQLSVCNRRFYSFMHQVAHAAQVKCPACVEFVITHTLSPACVYLSSCCSFTHAGIAGFGFAVVVCQYGEIHSMHTNKVEGVAGNTNYTRDEQFFS